MRKEEIVTNCIDDILAGKSTLDDCLARYPDIADELSALLRIAESIQPQKSIPTENFKLRARLRLLAEMESSKSTTRDKSGILGWLSPFILRPVPLFIIVVLLILVITGSTTVYASQKSLPDDILYPVKTGVEDLQLALTRSPEAKASIHLKLAQRRLDEVVAQSKLGRDISTAALEDIATQLDAALMEIEQVLPDETKELLSDISGLTLYGQGKLGQLFTLASESEYQALEKAINAERRGNLIAMVGYDNPAILGSAPSVRDERLESAYFELRGILQDINDSSWTIGGILIRNVNTANDIPAIGSWVKIEGIVRGEETFIGEIKNEQTDKEGIRIKGIFDGMNPDGVAWYIGGIELSAPQNVSPPPEGSRVDLEGIVVNGIFTLNKTEIEERDEIEERNRERVEVDGVLIDIDQNEETIVVKVANSRVDIDVSSAQIKGDERALDISDLELLLGREIEVFGLYNEDGFFTAIEVSVDIEFEDGSDETEDREIEEEVDGVEDEGGYGEEEVDDQKEYHDEEHSENQEEEED